MPHFLLNALDISRKKPPTSGATSKNPYTLFLYKNKLYKNNEAELGQKIRTNLEHFEAGKCKDKKNDKLYFFKTRYRRMTWMPSKSLKKLKKLKKSKSKNKIKNKINLVSLRKIYDEIDSIFFVYNVKMRENQRPFTGTEITIIISLGVFFTING